MRRGWDASWGPVCWSAAHGRFWKRSTTHNVDMSSQEPVGQTIAFRGLSFLAAPRPLDRVEKVLHQFNFFDGCEDFISLVAHALVRAASTLVSSLGVISPLFAAPPLCGGANPGCRRLSGGATHWKASPQASSFLTLFHELSRAEGPSQQTTKTDRLSHCPTPGESCPLRS